ncbi:hypothetical protein ABKN59_006981 [Abortiporus biennis]
MGIQNSLTTSALSSKLLNIIFTSLSRFPNLSKLHLRRILTTTSILRSISICTITSLVLDGCPANITSSEIQKDSDPLEFKLTHLKFIHLDVDVVNRYADPWWMILINPSTIQFLAIDGFHMPYTFITQLASPIMPPLKHLHTLELIANTLPPVELGIALKKMPGLTELTVNDPSQPFVEDDPSNSLDSQSHNFAQLFPEEVVPELKKVSVYYQIALPLCRGRQLQSVTTSGAMKEEEAVCLYKRLRDGSSNSLSSLSMAMETVTMEYLTNVLTTFSTLRLLAIVMKKRARFTAAEARRMLLDVALPVTLYTFEVRKNTDSDGMVLYISRLGMSTRKTNKKLIMVYSYITANKESFGRIADIRQFSKAGMMIVCTDHPGLLTLSGFS